MGSIKLKSHIFIKWFVPISTKYYKYKKIYDNKKLRVGKKPVYNFVFGKVLGKDATFLIQNIFPTTEKYIEKKYTNSNKDVEIPIVVKEEIVNESMYFENLEDVKNCSKEIICFYSNNDPYVKYEAEKEFADIIATEQILMPNAGHINAEAGYDTFEEIVSYL